MMSRTVSFFRDIFPFSIPFYKMHSYGNFFLILDTRGENDNLLLSSSDISNIQGIGLTFDQLFLLKGNDIAVVYNKDGGLVRACGNGTRCIADLIMRETCQEFVHITIDQHVFKCYRSNRDSIIVDMGNPSTSWETIPTSNACLTDNVVFSSQKVLGLPFAFCVNTGVPHTIFFVQDIDCYDIEVIGPLVEHDNFFPERTNVSLAQVSSPKSVIARVWERGTGVTGSCGTGACAIAYAGFCKGLTDQNVSIIFQGGELNVVYDTNNHALFLEGPSILEDTGILIMTNDHRWYWQKNDTQ